MDVRSRLLSLKGTNAPASVYAATPSLDYTFCDLPLFQNLLGLPVEKYKMTPSS